MWHVIGQDDLAVFLSLSIDFMKSWHHGSLNIGKIKGHTVLMPYDISQVPTENLASYFGCYYFKTFSDLAIVTT